MEERGPCARKSSCSFIQCFPPQAKSGRKRQRPIGRDSDLYHRVVHEWLDIIKAADDMGVWGASTIEHHLHSEGYEVGPNPGVLNAWWAGQVKNLHIGALGYVMATQDPIRVAEETAILDHITKGKYFVGFARGYQSRWANILGQFTNSVATVSDGSAEDIKNRDIFEERVGMVLRCWQEESVVLDGRYYKAPYPLETGVRNYPAVAIARDAGAPGEIDAGGNVRRISVVPAPFQKPHPPVFVATSKSDNSVRYCARNGFIPTYFSKLDGIIRQSQIYVEEAAKTGRHLRVGQRQNIVRWLHIGDTEADYHRKLREYDVDIYKNFYGPSSRNSRPTRTPIGSRTSRSPGFTVAERSIRCASDWQRTYEQVPAEYITLIFHYAQQPKDDVIRELELFMSKVVPSLEAVEPDAVAAE